MLVSDLFGSMRFLLHDNDRASDTGQYFYSDESLGKAISEAVALTAKDLILPPLDEKTFQYPPRKAHLTVAPLAKDYTPTWTGTQPNNSAPLPDDFFILECGSLGGYYVPAARMSLGGTIAGLTISKLYASAGKLYGPLADTVYYFRQTPRLDPATDGPLPLLSDGFYNAAKYMACKDLMVQHSKSGYQRHVFFDGMYKEMIRSLQ